MDVGGAKVLIFHFMTVVPIQHLVDATKYLLGVTSTNLVILWNVIQVKLSFFEQECILFGQSDFTFYTRVHITIVDEYESLSCYDN